MKDVTTEFSSTRPKSSFLGDVVKLVSGNAFAQILSILASPILTRLYAPEAFGDLALFTSITSIIGVIVCLRYELAIMLPEKDEEAANLIALSIGIAAVISLISIPIIWLAGSQIAGLLNAPNLSHYLWLIPPTLFFGGIGVGHPALNFWATRTRRFKELSVTRVISSIITTSIKLGAGFVGLATSGSMIGANVIGSIVSPLILAGQIWREEGKRILHSIRWRGVIYNIKRYRDFPLYSTWSALLNTTSVQLPSLLLATFFSSTVVGYYALGYRILQTPMGIIGNAIGQVFFQRASVAVKKGNLASVVENTFLHLLILGIYPFALLAGAGSEIFTILFGKSWANAGLYAQLLAPWIFFVFIHSPISTLFIIREKQKVGLAYNIVLLVSRIVSLIIGGVLKQPLAALGLFALTGTISIVIIDLWLLHNAGVNIVKLLVTTVPYICLSIINLAILLGAKWIFNINNIWIIALSVLTTLLYYLYVLRRDKSIINWVRDFITNLGTST